jgi:cysteine synthase
MKIHDNILGTIGNTPVVKINKLGPAGVNLFVKIESFNPMGSVKDRLALGIIEDAEESGALKPGQTIVEATSGIPVSASLWSVRKKATRWWSPWRQVSVSSGAN